MLYKIVIEKLQKTEPSDCFLCFHLLRSLFSFVRAFVGRTKAFWSVCSFALSIFVDWANFWQPPLQVKTIVWKERSCEKEERTIKKTAHQILKKTWIQLFFFLSFNCFSRWTHRCREKQLWKQRYWLWDKKEKFSKKFVLSWPCYLCHYFRLSDICFVCVFFCCCMQSLSAAHRTHAFQFFLFILTQSFILHNKLLNSKFHSTKLKSVETASNRIEQKRDERRKKKKQ